MKKHFVKFHFVLLLFSFLPTRVRSSSNPPYHNYTLHDFKDYKGRSQIVFTSQGNADFRSSINSQAGTSNFHGLNIRKSLHVQNSILGDGQMKINGEIFADKMNIKSHMVGNSANFDGKVQIKGNMTALSSIQILGQMNLAQSMEISKGRLTIGKHLSLSNNGYIQARFFNSTGDAHVEGHIRSKGDMSTNGKITSKLGFYTKDGAVKAKEIEVIDSIKIIGSDGQMKAKHADFSGKVKIHELISSNAEFQSISILKSITTDRKSNLNVEGNMITDGDVLFSRGFKSSSNANIEGHLNVKETIQTKKIIVDQIIEAPSITFKKNGKLPADAKDVLVNAKGGIVQAKDIISTSSMKTNTMEATSDISTEAALKAQSIFATTSIHGRELNILQNARVNVLNSNTVQINKTLSVDGQAQINTIKVESDCVIGGKVTAKEVLVSSNLKALSIQSSGHIIAESILSKRNITTGGNLLSSRIVVGDSLEVGRKIQTKDLNVTKSIWSDDISTSHLTILNKLESRSDAQMLGNVIMKKDLNVHGNMSLMGFFSCKANIESFNITAIGSLRSTKNLYCDEDAFVRGNIFTEASIHSSSANVTEYIISNSIQTNSAQVRKTLTIEGELRMPSMMNVTAKSIDLNLPVVIQNASVSILNNSLTVGNDISTRSLVVKESIESSLISAINLTVHDHLEVLGRRSKLKSYAGFETIDGNVTCKNAIVSGDIKSLGGIYATVLEINDNAAFHGNLNAGNVVIENGLISPKLTVTGTFHSKSIAVTDSLHIGPDGNLTSNSTVHFHNDTIIDKTLYANEGEFKNGIKMKSAFASRVYTEDVLASGFISSSSIIAKGDVKIHGEANVKRLIFTEIVKGPSVKVDNSLTCTTAKVNGMLTSAGITAQKVTVNGDIILDGINVREKLKELQVLREQVSRLEKLIQELMKK